MRVAILSDVHSNLAALRAVLDDMPEVDEILCAGDVVGYAAEPNEVIQLLKEVGARCVMGNHDHACLYRRITGMNELAATAVFWTNKRLTGESISFLRSLPERLELKLSGHKIFMVHGSPRDPLWEYVFPDISNSMLFELMKGVDADLVILGHTHVPMQRMILGKLVLNPGGVGQPRDYDPRASYLLLELGEEPSVEFRRVKYDIDATAEKIREAGLPEELAARLYFGW